MASHRIRKRGRRANASGQYGEATVESMCELAGFRVVPYLQYNGDTPMMVRQYPVPHPFRPDVPRSGKNDFMLFSGVTKAYVQVKNQDRSGTCDEKLAFAFDIARFAVYDTPFDLFALVLLGQWWIQRPLIPEWARKKCAEFEMLCNGTRLATKAKVIVGPKELSSWLMSIERRTTHTNGRLF